MKNWFRRDESQARRRSQLSSHLPLKLCKGKNDKISRCRCDRWWDHETEANHVNKRAWSNAGWKVESLDVDAKWVKFVRAGAL